MTLLSLNVQKRRISKLCASTNEFKTNSSSQVTSAVLAAMGIMLTLSSVTAFSPLSLVDFCCRHTRLRSKVSPVSLQQKSISSLKRARTFRLTVIKAHGSDGEEDLDPELDNRDETHYELNESNPISHSNIENTNGFNGDEDEEDDCDDDVNSNLNKISWLPSVKLGRTHTQDNIYSSSTSWDTSSSFSRVENIDGDTYDLVDRDRSTESHRGDKKTQILPVLPMNMVQGLERLFVEHDEGSNSSNQDDGNDDDEFSRRNLFGSGVGYGTGVWEENSSMAIGAPVFTDTSVYLPHTKGHVLTIAEPRYKKLYDDLLQMGSYYGKKREGAIRRAREKAGGKSSEEIKNLPDPDEKRRFIVTMTNPKEDGVFAEYGVIFQLRDLDEVAAIATYDVGGDRIVSIEELKNLIDPAELGYDDTIEEDFIDVLTETHYEATHDVVGRVKIHRFINPECWDSGPGGEEYLLAEATILDAVDSDYSKSMDDRRRKMTSVVEKKLIGTDSKPASLASAQKMNDQLKQQAIGDVAKAVARIRDEMRSAVGESFSQKQTHDQTEGNHSSTKSSIASRSKRQIPLVPKGILIERRPDGSLLKEEISLRESFAKLVSLQQELMEKFRFTRESIKSFGIGSVGMWLSCAAWSKFVGKRLEASHGEMQSDLQEKVVKYLAGKNEVEANDQDSIHSSYIYDDDNEGEDDESEEVVDFEDLSPELQHEFQVVQSRATEELGPVALQRAIQMQRIVQAESYIERLKLLRECVDSERKRLEAKKMLKLALNTTNNETGGNGRQMHSTLSREEARLIFERLMLKETVEDGTKLHEKDTFQ